MKSKEELWNEWLAESEHKERVMKEKCTQSFKDINGKPANGFKFNGKYINE